MSSPDTQESPDVAAAEAELDAALQQVKSEKNEPSLEGGTPPLKEEVEKPDVAAQQKPKGYDPVDLDTLSEEIKAPIKERLDYLYKQTKTSDERNRALIAHNKQLEEGLNALFEREGQRTHKEVASEYENARNFYMQELQSARDYGDGAKEAKILQDFIRLEASQMMQQAQPKQQPAQQQPQELPPFNAEEASYVTGLTKEKDESGKPLRPWLTKADPNFGKAVDIAKKIAKDLESKGQDASIYDIMPRLEKYMNAKPAAQGGAIGGSEGGLTLPAKNNKMVLSDGQRYAAKKLGINLKQSGVDTEAQMAKLSTLKRARLEDLV